MISRPVDVIRTSLNGTENLLELAKEKQVRSMVYVSSMEMYGALNLQNDQMVTEEMTGYLNPLALRSNYPESKRMCENMCVAYGSGEDRKAGTDVWCRSIAGRKPCFCTVCKKCHEGQ